jgi:hypothetical protein
MWASCINFINVIEFHPHFELLNFANDYFGQQDLKSQVVIKTLHCTSIFNN